MKKSIIYLMITAIVFSIGCKKDDTAVVKPVSLSVQLSYSDDQKKLNLPFQDIELKISNSTNGQSYTAKADATGLATFESVSPGNYVVSATNTLTAEQYASITGITTEGNVTFNASSNAIVLENQTVQLVLIPGRIGNLVVKQFYYAGSNTSTGASFRDQFLEIYNNSNDTIYADSLYIGDTWSNQKKLSAGATRFDWSKSIGMPANIGDASNDYIYARYLFMIPGSGKDHPIEPGKSIIIAQNALNHTKPYVNNAGNTISITDPTQTVDLSHADFETYLVNFAKNADPSGKAFASDLDNPDVLNVDVLTAAVDNDWVLNATGWEDVFIFKTNERVDSWQSYPDPTVTSVNSSTKLYKQIPVKYVIDAVEIMPPIPANGTPKRLPVSLDGGPTFVKGGQYSSQSLIRKTAKTTNGRIILQDTNNSTNDFDTKAKADPSKSAASFTIN